MRGIIGVSGTLETLSFGAQPVAGLIRVVDGGGPDSRQDTFEWALAVGPFPVHNASGDIVVTDAQALPTSKEQCRNGGWRTFPGFRNQGNCVSFVATGGKNPPGAQTG